MLGTHADVCYARLIDSATAAEGGRRGPEGGAAAQEGEHESVESVDKSFQNRVREVRRRTRLLRNFQALRQGDTDTGCSVTLGVVGGVQPNSLVGEGGPRSGGGQEEGCGVAGLEEEAEEKGGGRKRGGRRGRGADVDDEDGAEGCVLAQEGGVVRSYPTHMLHLYSGGTYADVC